MSLYYYKSDVGNIGDDINAWLWQDLLELERVRKDTKLIGFGSILTSKLNEIIDDRTIKQKIVLGAGVRSIDVLPKVDATWDLSFLRGPISSVFLTNSLDNYITDGAYALWLHRRFDDLQKEEKKFEISFMPYLRTSSLMPWQKICDAVGIHLISPHPARGWKAPCEKSPPPSVSSPRPCTGPFFRTSSTYPGPKCSLPPISSREASTNQSGKTGAEV
jgi:hypothetical protein